MVLGLVTIGVHFGLDIGVRGAVGFVVCVFMCFLRANFGSAEVGMLYRNTVSLLTAVFLHFLCTYYCCCTLLSIACHNLCTPVCRPL